jgi:hypothetical protein
MEQPVSIPLYSLNLSKVSHKKIETVFSPVFKDWTLPKYVSINHLKSHLNVPYLVVEFHKTSLVGGLEHFSLFHISGIVPPTD